MKKSITLLLIITTISISCKNEKTPEVIGTNEAGEQLTIDEKGDTVVYVNEEIIDENQTPENEVITQQPEEEKTAFKKNADGTYSFEYNLEKGKTYTYALAMNQVQTIDNGAQSAKLTSHKTTTMDYLVEEANNGKFKLKGIFKEFSERISDSEGNSMSYNTKSPKPSNEAAIKSWTVYKAIVGQTYNMEVDSKGNVLSVSGIDKVQANIKSKLGSEFSSDEKKGIEELLKFTLSSEIIKAQFEETLKIFPDKPLKSGESWSESQAINEGPLKGSVKMTRTLKEIGAEKTTITINGSQNVKGSETQEQEGVKITLSANNTGSVKGSIVLDTKSGWISKVNMTKTETVKQTASDGNQSQSMTQTSTITTTVNN